MESHLQSDVPLGVFLSSGIDSSAIAGIAQARHSEQVHAFTVSFPDDGDYDETTIASEVATRNGFSHKTFPIDHATALKWAQDGLAAMDQPAADGLNTFMVSRAARESGLTVALSGLGGDEMFGGYASFEKIPGWLKGMRVAGRLPRRMRTLAAAIASARRDPAASAKAHDLAVTNGTVTDLYLAFRRNLSNKDMEDLGSTADGLEANTFLSRDHDLPDEVSDDAIATVSRLESAFYLRNTLLRDSDVFGMANSLEIRVPFLHKPLVEWSLKTPGHSLLPNGRADKALLRTMAAPYLVPAQTEQAKKGFVLPLGPWTRGPLKQLVNDSLDSLKASGLVDAKGVDAVSKRLGGSDQPGPSFRLWSLVALGVWVGNRLSAPPLVPS